jgi:hypothetical protein
VWMALFIVKSSDQVLHNIHIKNLAVYAGGSAPVQIVTKIDTVHSVDVAWEKLIRNHHPLQPFMPGDSGE